MDDFGKFVDNYQEYVETPGGMEFELGRKPALKLLGDINDKTVLNFGCGPGVNTRELLGMGARVIGLDISEEELAVARLRHPRVEYIHYDGIHLEEALGGRQVDAVLASFAICTISDEILTQLLPEMRRVLRPGGKLVIADPNWEEAIGTKYHDLHYHAQPDVKNGDYVHVTLGRGKNKVELYHDVYRSQLYYHQLLYAAGFTRTSTLYPWPRGWQLLKWWKALAVPPFMVMVAE